MTSHEQAVIDAAVAWRRTLTRIDTGKSTGGEAFDAADRLRRMVDAYLRHIPCDDCGRSDGTHDMEVEH